MRGAPRRCSSAGDVHLDERLRPLHGQREALLSEDPSRHVWGLGRHYVGSNFFWYFRDPAGNFAEYYTDMDVIIDDQLWHPQVFEGMRSLYAWGPPPPASFIRPDDLAELMAG